MQLKSIGKSRHLLANSSLFILKTYFDGNSQELKSATIKDNTDKM